MAGMRLYRLAVSSIAFAYPVFLMAPRCLPSNCVSTVILRFGRAHHAAFCRRSKGVVPVLPLWRFPASAARFILTIRALDAWLQGKSYREIAEGLFGKEQVIGRFWRDNDLRSRIIRLVQNGVAMMRGGYRALLRPPPRE